MSDPVAQKSGFLKTYMSHHPDTLVAYAKYFGRVTDSITTAEMSAIDSNVSDFGPCFNDRISEMALHG